MKEKFYKTISIIHGSECCPLNKKEEIKMEVAAMRTLRLKCDETSMNRTSNGYTYTSIWVNLGETNIVGKSEIIDELVWTFWEKKLWWGSQKYR